MEAAVTAIHPKAVVLASGLRHKSAFGFAALHGINTVSHSQNRLKRIDKSLAVEDKGNRSTLDFLLQATG
jgi:hypothetical protein